MKELNGPIAAAIVEGTKSIAEKGDKILYEFLSKITALAQEELRSDRVTIFLLDREKRELWSIIELDQEEHLPNQQKHLEIRVPVGQGIVGEAGQKKIGEFVNESNVDKNDAPRFAEARKQDEITGYTTYNILAIPMFNAQNELVAVVEFINKLKDNNLPDSQSHQLKIRVDHQGFTNTDPKKFDEISHIIIKLLEGFKDLYETTRKRQRQLKLEEAIRSVSKGHAESSERFKAVKKAAQELVNADRSTLWLLDRKNKILYQIRF
ncbi:MAG: GAF domain-containing protein [Symploca sp. SIO2E6]|nr:GAF domain-containing protein [Symploca sp. SIO2E6]